MAGCIDIPLRRNEVWSKRFQLTDDQGAPLDMSGWLFAMHVRGRTNNAALIAAAQISASELAQGAVTITLDASEGTPLSAYGSPLQTENLPYDLRAIDASGTKLVLLHGIVILSRGITHE